MNIFKLFILIFTAFSSTSFSVNDVSYKPFEGFSLGFTTSVDLQLYVEIFEYFPSFGPHLSYNYYTHEDSYIHFSAYFSRTTRLISMAFGGQFMPSTRYRMLFPDEFIDYEEDFVSDPEDFINISSVWVANSLPDIFLGSSFLLNKRHSLGFGASFVNMAMGVFIKHSVNLSGNLFISFMMNYSYFIVELLNPAEQELSFYISFNYNF